MALEGLSRGIFRSIGLLKSKRKLDDEELREMTRSLRRALQEADFNVRQTKEIVERMESRLREEQPRPGITLQTHAMNILYTELVGFWVQLINSSLTALRYCLWDCTDKVRPQPLQNWQNGTVASMAYVSQ